MKDNLETVAFLEMGFRPFFLGAALFAAISMVLWSAIYLFQLPVEIESVTIFEWHAHEMFYGYAFAVIAGFLLTSVRNWTHLPTAHGSTLLLLFMLWAAARILFMFGTAYIWIAGIFDIAFALCLSYILTRRIVKAGKWNQLGIVTKLLLIMACNILFYLGALGMLEHGVAWGIYGGLYIVIALILTMGRRVIPFFIERATGDAVKLFNSRWIDLSSLLFFLLFTVNELFFGQHTLSAYLALALFIINAIRLVGWHHPVIWKQSLLWSVYLAFWMITLGFALFALPYFAAPYFGDISRLLAIHAFTVGGIGMITMGIMARVSLGHTGNNVYQPPVAVTYALAAILLSAVARIILPLLDLWPYAWLIGLSQGLWIAAFLIFTAVYAPILIRPGKRPSL
ncbi:MAG: NnrS family protein [Mariprofundaceae bacterium]|nr:NnrS family protein [Mariprofundaceae bacterium]